MAEKCTKERFLHDVRKHQIKIIRDEGVYRHVRFSRPESNTFQFDLITWQGHLCYTGDMGTFVFQRVEDMFTFFRGSLDDKYPINSNYWGQKLLSESRFGEGFKEFDKESFIECIRNEFKEHYSEMLEDCEEMECLGQMEETWEEIDDEVLYYACDGEDVAMRSAYEFKASDGFTFDIEYIHAREYTFYYIWCCYAMVWGISLYDKTKEKINGNRR